MTKGVCAKSVHDQHFYTETAKMNSFLCTVISPGRRRVYTCRKRAGLAPQSHRGPGAVCPRTDTWSAGFPPGSAG